MQKVDLNLSSESAEKPPGWWIRKGKASRQAYIKRHPKSKWSKFLDYGIDTKKKPQPDKKKVKPKKKKISDLMNKSQKSSKKKINDVKSKAKTEVSKKQEIQQKAEAAAPKIKRNLNAGMNKLVTKASAYSSKIKDSMSHTSTRQVGAFFKKKLTNGETTEAEQEAVKAAITPVLRAVLGVALLGSMAVGAGPLVAALASSYTSSLDGLLGNDEEAPDSSDAPLESESAELNTDEPIDLLIHDFMRWFSKIDKDALARKIAELQILETEGSADEEETSNEGDEEDPDFSSESAVVKRVSFRVVPLQRRVATNLRTKFEVVFDREVVGHIESDPKISGDGFQNRCWVVTLRDGFNESAYVSGFSKDEPFTSVRGEDVLLRNPQRMTMPEARSWTKGALVRSFL